MTRLLIAASGTGGHLFPALAVAESLPKYWKVSWLGVPDRLENQLVPQKYRLVTIRAEGLHGGGLRMLLQGMRLLVATWQVRQILLRDKINAVFTTGGYIAAPAILGALSCGLPVLLHESNACPGRVTRLLGRFCTQVALGLPRASNRLKGCKTVVTGTPVRALFFSPQRLPDWVPSGVAPLLVVMGGSQGAIGLNQMVRCVFPWLLNKGCRIVHLTGSLDPDLGQIKHPNLVEKQFTDEIPGLLQHADLVISRSGASALSELLVCRTPSILVPYPFATDRHQEENAACAAELGSAIIVHQHKPGDRALKDALWRLLGSQLDENNLTENPLLCMQKTLDSAIKKNATNELVSVLETLN